MHYTNFTIVFNEQILRDTFIFRLSPEKNNELDFLPGQYVFLKNQFYKPDEPHPFSIASSPLEKKYLEFCIKTYGDWTEKISELTNGTIMQVSEAQGNFVWDKDIQHAVYLLGGLGISPIMSMLRTIALTDKKPQSLTILYGNRTPDTIAYHEELKKLTEVLPLNIVHIFSHLEDTDPWTGYRGFITENIIRNEADLASHPTFFVVGPPIFIEKMLKILADLSVPKDKIKQEKLEIIIPE